jgi:hypothetical protein
MKRIKYGLQSHYKLGVKKKKNGMRTKHRLPFAIGQHITN